ncbi:MAG TPA: excinuclease ABC subunit UvrC, partial [Bacilli bacterium]|nr:excinuclease ABC subunit UvrC [Bacilli bacterium]
RQIVDMLNRVYPLKKCENMPKKECLYYHINECLGYCIKSIDKSVVDSMLKEIILFLKGNSDILKSKINIEMKEAAKNLNYEKAKELRDMITYIDKTLEKQKIDIKDNIDRDIIGYYIKEDYISIQIFSIRDGKIVNRVGNIIDKIGDEYENIMYYIMNYYENNFKPKEVLKSSDIDISLLSKALNIDFLIPIKGIKKQLVNMVNENAKIVLEEKFELLNKKSNKEINSILELQKKLNINKITRIEAFDNSHLFGTYTVSGMVVFIDGKKSSKDYRKYKISMDSKDDYSLFKEVLYRRYYRLLEEKQITPNLIIIDGGENQVKVAKTILTNFNLNIPVYGLKKNSKHRTYSLVDETNEIYIDQKSDAFNLLENIQNEVHRFTINYHKQIRSKGALKK